ncbi:ion channel [Herbiconiux sp. A18JL235]|uniref:Ion channel n=1 Tax=Herbiconiux sp. A18JL235 TaxID=3152363 RepID=A0AB39BME2_9MICO
MVRATRLVRRFGYWLVLLLAAVSYVLCAAQQGPNPNPVAFIAQLAMVAVALWMAEVPRVLLRACWAVLAFAVVTVIVAEFAGLQGHVLDVILSAASALACLITPTAIIAHRVRQQTPGMQNLLAAVTAYVTIGMLFTFVYNFIALLSPSPVIAGETGDTLRGQLFYSFSTLTTIGYGNLVPLGPLMETLTVTQAITGQLFVVIAIAGMVTLRTSRKTETPSKEPSE